MPVSWQEKGSEQPIIGPELSCGISETVTKPATRDWMNRKHQEYQHSNTWTKTCKGFPSRTLCQRTRELLRLNRNHLRQVTGLLAGHCYLKEIYSNFGLVNSPTCETCHNIEELRFNYMGSHFLETK